LLEWLRREGGKPQVNIAASAHALSIVLDDFCACYEAQAKKAIKRAMTESLNKFQTVSESIVS